MTAIRAELPVTRVLIMSMHDDAQHVRSALERGAAGFVVKDAAPLELELALRTAAGGEVFLSPRLSSRMMAPLLGKPKAAGVESLSNRQRQILGMIGRGLSSKEIGAELGISVKTIGRNIKTLEEEGFIGHESGKITMDPNHNPIKRAVILEMKNGVKEMKAKIQPEG